MNKKEIIKTWMCRVIKNRLIRAHIWVFLALIISLLFSFLPIIISAAIKASAEESSLTRVILELILADTMFLYCSAFIAPFVLFTIKTTIYSRGQRLFLYPVALLASLYVLVLGALMYSGVVARNLYTLGQHSSSGTPPTFAEITIILSTLFVWYYCIFKEQYSPRSDYDDIQDKTFQKFDRVIQNED